MAACIGILPFSIATADDPAQPALPAPGAWASYQMTQTREGADEKSYHVEIRFLERVVENQRPYRWIEFVFWFDSREKPDGKNVLKTLVPEAELLSGAKPFANAIKVYNVMWDAAGTLTSVNEISSAADLEQLESFAGIFLQALPSRRKMGTVNDGTQQFDIQQGRLTCKFQLAGEHRSQNADNTPSRTLKYEFWLHDEVPLGFAELRTHATIFSDNGQMQLAAVTGTFTILNFGTGAKSELPEKN